MQKNKGDMYSLSWTGSSPDLGSLSLSLSRAYRLGERSAQLLQWETRTLCTPRAPSPASSFPLPKRSVRQQKHAYLLRFYIPQRSNKVCEDLITPK